MFWTLVPKGLNCLKKAGVSLIFPSKIPPDPVLFPKLYGEKRPMLNNTSITPSYFVTVMLYNKCNTKVFLNAKFIFILKNIQRGQNVSTPELTKWVQFLNLYFFGTIKGSSTVLLKYDFTIQLNANNKIRNCTSFD